MPRISAATLAEHRDRQRSALLTAARELLLSRGYEGLTFAALASRAGLGRSTVYAYFRSRDDVVVALCEVELPRVGEDIRRAVEATPAGPERVAAFVRVQLDAVHSGRYRLAHTLLAVPLSADARLRIAELHRDLVPGAEPLLAGSGHPRPALAAALLQGLVTTAAGLIGRGADPEQVTVTAVELALHGLGGASDGSARVPPPHDGASADDGEGPARG